MNVAVEMENKTTVTQFPSEEIIVDIQNIVLLQESKVTEETIGSQDDSAIATEDAESAESSTEDENENKLNLVQRSETFYKDARTYWKAIPATIDGMLGGYSNINVTDVRGSQDFLKDVFKMKPSPNKNVALDCGAGIGRVTKHLLIPIFNTVDIVEQDEQFANSVRGYVGNTTKLGTIYNQGLQEFQPKSMRYDVIWSQWVLGHLTNDDFVKFFERCSQALNKNGIIVVKENITSTDMVVIDEVDSSVTRPLQMVKALLAQSGLRIVKMVRQSNFPAAIFPVYMFAMKPVKRSH
ncbi:N-terminal Xaa-Pro-Lys N-methyltransferase 1-B [Bradysia coprophila]|uniref:N-terminal Xaa-Pro-Lys N-methyltransferase 1-B n=1 Tax=Bradysia coprophila TaxID=38358 RepID=UPI00187D9C80|nr:N-terminal Xaa-Pro-Lys N-methyltransferase 1-B [Bradysia coprophila]